MTETQSVLVIGQEIQLHRLLHPAKQIVNSNICPKISQTKL